MGKGKGMSKGKGKGKGRGSTKCRSRGSGCHISVELVYSPSTEMGTNTPCSAEAC